MAKKDPAFLMYSNDWLEGTAELMPDEKGVYIDLLCYQHQKGDLPNDVNRLSRLVRLPINDFIKIWEIIKDKFEQHGNRLVNQKLNEVMTERLMKGKKNTISGTFASLLRKNNLSKKEYAYIKNKFKVDDFEHLDKESITERLTEWFDKCLKSIEDENEDENENEDINIINVFFERFKEITNKNLRIIDNKFKKQFNARIKEGYTLDDLITATINCSKDQYHIDNPKYLTPEFITRSDKLQKYLNSEISKEQPKDDRKSFKIKHHYSGTLRTIKAYTKEEAFEIFNKQTGAFIKDLELC